jgi:hypothetical protein
MGFFDRFKKQRAELKDKAKDAADKLADDDKA